MAAPAIRLVIDRLVELPSRAMDHLPSHSQRRPLGHFVFHIWPRHPSLRLDSYHIIHPLTKLRSSQSLPALDPRSSSISGLEQMMRLPHSRVVDV
jgi:hypothetical protein